MPNGTRVFHYGQAAPGASVGQARARARAQQQQRFEVEPHASRPQALLQASKATVHTRPLRERRRVAEPSHGTSKRPVRLRLGHSRPRIFSTRSTIACAFGAFARSHAPCPWYAENASAKYSSPL